VTTRAILGLVVFNVFLLAVGAGVLWGIRGWRWWTDFVRLAGVAYLLGLCALTIVMTYELVLGVPIRAATIVLNGAAIVLLGVLVGRRRRLEMPRLRPPAWRFPGISVFVALFAAGIVVYFEGLFRAQRLAGVGREWDSWANWLPKTRELYASGRLEPRFLEQITSQVPGYPPGPAVIQAAAFHAMGSADAVTLHLQYWFIAAGFVLATVGLLARRVHGAILLPLLLAFLVTPTILNWISTVYADLPLGYLVAIAGLLLVLWIDERKRWQLAAATVLLAGAMLTKREGIAFAACVVLAGFAASFGSRRELWRALLVAGLAAFALALPWRIWIAVHGLTGDGPELGYVGAFSHLDVVWPALKLNVTTLFDSELWRYAPFVALAAIVVAGLARAWTPFLFTAAYVAGAIAVGTWVFWTNPVAYNDEWPIHRYMAVTVLVLAVLVPLLLARAWSSVSPSRRSDDPPAPDALFRPSLAAWAIVGVGLLSHPLSVLAGYSGSGLPGAWPAFPLASACSARPADDERVRIVVGYADSYPEAMAMRARARAAGLVATQAAQDGCGRVRVYVDDLMTMEAADALLARAKAGGLGATVERDPDD
jgi:hypothetical protein